MRICRSQKQKWDLFAACLQHLQLVIAALQPGMLQPQTNSHTTPPPGLSVMLDMLRKPLTECTSLCIPALASPASCFPPDLYMILLNTVDSSVLDLV